MKYLLRQGAADFQSRDHFCNAVNIAIQEGHYKVVAEFCRVTKEKNIDIFVVDNITSDTNKLIQSKQSNMDMPTSSEF